MRRIERRSRGIVNSNRGACPLSANRFPPPIRSGAGFRRDVRSADRGPRAVGITAGGAARDLGPAANIDGMTVFAAACAGARIIGPRNDRSVILAVIAAPADRG